MTRKTEEKSVLPLMGDNNIPVFDSRNNTEILRKFSLEGTTLNMTPLTKTSAKRLMKNMPQ